MNKIFLKFAFVMAVAGGVASYSSILYSNSNLPADSRINNKQQILSAGTHENETDVSSFIEAKATSITRSNAAYTVNLTLQFTGELPTIEGTTNPDLVNYDYIYALGYRTSAQFPVASEDEIIPVVEITTEKGVYTGEVEKIGNNTSDFIGEPNSDFGTMISTKATIIAEGSIQSAKVLKFIRCRYNRTTDPKDPLPVPKIGSEFTELERKFAYANLNTSSTKYYDLNGTYDADGNEITPLLLETKLSSISKFNQIISFKTEITTYFNKNYLSFLKTNLKASVLEKIESGKYKISSKLNSAVTGYLYVQTDKGNTYKYQSSSFINYFTDGTMSLNLIADQGSGKIDGNITKIYVSGLSIATYVYEPTSSPKQTPQLGTSVYFDISLLDLNPTNASTNVIDFDLIFILVELFLIVVVAGLAVLNFFRAKKAGEGKEFGEVNKTEFIKTSIMSGLAVVSISLFLLSAIVRTSYMNNSFAVYNPLDVFIIVTAISSIILIGFFIRYFLIVIKNYRAKRKADAMKTTKKEYYF